MWYKHLKDVATTNKHIFHIISKFDLDNWKQGEKKKNGREAGGYFTQRDWRKLTGVQRRHKWSEWAVRVSREGFKQKGAGSTMALQQPSLANEKQHSPHDNHHRRVVRVCVELSEACLEG